jgi:hypothetical protein
VEVHKLAALASDYRVAEAFWSNGCARTTPVLPVDPWAREELVVGLIKHDVPPLWGRNSADRRLVVPSAS